MVATEAEAVRSAAGSVVLGSVAATEEAARAAEVRVAARAAVAGLTAAAAPAAGVTVGDGDLFPSELPPFPLSYSHDVRPHMPCVLNPHATTPSERYTSPSGTSHMLSHAFLLGFCSLRVKCH